MAKVKDLKYFAPLLVIFLIFVVPVKVSAAGVQIDSPKDKTITPDTRLIITGSAADAKALSVNGTKVELEPGGKLSAAAILRPGKNLVSVAAITSGGTKLSKNIRILRIITYDDIERSYDEKPYWAKSQIISLSTLRIIEGYPDNTFQPDRAVSRGELATWITRARNLKVAHPKKDMFFDVPKEHWRAPYIKAVVDLGIMKGIKKDAFGIDESVKRSDAVAIFAKAFNISTISVLNKSSFIDVSASSGGSGDIYSAKKKGLVVGVTPKQKIFEPEREIKRAEVATIISRLEEIKNITSLLYDFGHGYTSARYCMIGTKPVIKNVTLSPQSSAADGRTPIKISASVADAQGPSDISQVWADITSVGGPNNAKMNISAEKLYEIIFTVTPEVESGEKAISVKALDKSGLESSVIVKLIITGEKK